jgi:hypothetical protein
MATPASVLADDPPGTVSRVSLKVEVNRLVTVEPGGLVVSSLTAGSIAVPLATGASLTGSTVSGMVTVADE